MSKLNIVFVSIFDITKTLYKISSLLDRQKYNIFWITTNELWSNYLYEQGVRKDNLLELVYGEDDFLEQEKKEYLKKEIIGLESSCNLNIYQCLQMDQHISQNPRHDIEEYVYLYYKNIKNFLVENNVTHVFAEPTNFNELITHMICEKMGIKFLSPKTMRYPDDRLIIAKGYSYEKIIDLESSNDLSGRELLERFEKKNEVPSYFKINNSRKILSWKGILTNIKNRVKQKSEASGNHLTYHPIKNRVKFVLNRYFNSINLKRRLNYSKINQIDGKLAYYSLHAQPEYSIDVVGSYFSNQLKLIKDIRRALPFDFTLIVKEHPNVLGIRPFSFFKEIQDIPGVKLVNPMTSSFEIYKYCDVVLTVSGTTAYEAGLLGIPAIMFAPVYFNELSSVRYCDNISNLKDLIQEFVINFQRDIEADIEYLDKLLSHSFQAYWLDPFTDLSVLDGKNISKLAEAFERAIDKTTN